MKVITNMQLLGGSSDDKKTTGSFSLKFNAQKVNHLCLKLLKISCTENKMQA